MISVLYILFVFILPLNKIKWFISFLISILQRFNVMITRAKSLLVIVGDPHSLQHDANWNKLIEYCLENNAMIQSLYRFPY